MKGKIIGWTMALCAVLAGLALPINTYAVTRVATNLEKFDETGFLVTRINPGDNTITVLVKDTNVKHVVLLMRDNKSIYQEWEFDISSDLQLPHDMYEWGETMLLDFGTEALPLNTELKMKVKDGVSLAKQGSYGIFYYGVRYHNGEYKVGKIGFEDCMNEILQDADSLVKYECRISFDDPGLYYISDDETQFLSPATLEAIVVRDEEGAPIAAQMQYKYTKELVQDNGFGLPGETEIWEDYYAELDGAEKMLERLGLKTSDAVLREEAEAAAARAEAELAAAQREIDFLRRDRDTLIRELDGLWQQIIEMEGENTSLNGEVEELQRLNSLLEEKKAELESLNALLKEKEDGLELENQLLSGEKKKLEDELEKTKEELAIISEKFELAIENMNVNVAKMDSAKEQMGQINARLEEANAKLEVAGVKFEAASAQIEIAGAQIEDARGSLGNEIKRIEDINREFGGLKNELIAALGSRTVEVVKVNENTVEKETKGTELTGSTGSVNNYYNYGCENNGSEVGVNNILQKDDVPELGEETICPWWVLIPLTAIGTFVGCWWLLPDWHLKHKRK